MEKEIEFLNYIFKNAEMGIIGIDQVITEVENVDFERLLNEQRDDYKVICMEAKELLNEYNETSKHIGNMAKISSDVMVKMEMLKDKSINTIAKMMIEGTNKGIIEIQEKINNYDVENKDIVHLAKKLLKMEERNIEYLKEFL